MKLCGMADYPARKTIAASSRFSAKFYQKAVLAAEQTVKKLFDFIEASPSQFHAIENQKQRLISEGYEQLFG